MDAGTLPDILTIKSRV